MPHLATNEKFPPPVPLTYPVETAFDIIESTQEYLTLLSDTARETREAVEALIPADPQPGRRTRALGLVSDNLAKLELTLRTSLRILNDLRSLRRLLLQERAATAMPATRRLRPYLEGCLAALKKGGPLPLIESQEKNP